MSGVVNSQVQFGRRAQLVVTRDDNTGLDLSQLHFKFKLNQSDIETPNSCVVRIYNLSKKVMDEITGRGSLEFSNIVLDAGYENSTQFGTIFQGTIKQFRRGREANTDAYLDLLASDNDVGYNYKVISETFPAGTTAQQRLKRAAEVMAVNVGDILKANGTLGGTVPSPRSKVAFGLVRNMIRDEAETNYASWTVQDGALTMIPLTGYLPGEAVLLNSFTGMIGVPEQTDEGVKVRTLLNPRLRVSGLVKINNGDINQITARGDSALPVGQVAFNDPRHVQLPADISADGFYRLFVVEHCGDTRGGEWYSDCTCLSIDPSDGIVPAYG